MHLEAMLKLHSGLPREAPGSDASTRRAIGMLPASLAPQRIADMGCGPGRSACLLAQAFPRASVLAIDVHPPFLAQLAHDCPASNIETRIATMDAPGIPPSTVDLIWAEGSAYVIGRVRALKCWRPLLADRGWLAFTELEWLTDSPPAGARDFWQTAYPDMVDGATVDAALRTAGFDALPSFVLPASDWMEYYAPLERRMNALRGEPDMADVLAETAREIEVYRQFGASFGYVFHVARGR